MISEFYYQKSCPFNQRNALGRVYGGDRRNFNAAGGGGEEDDFEFEAPPQRRGPRPSHPDAAGRPLSEEPDTEYGPSSRRKYGGGGGGGGGEDDYIPFPRKKISDPEQGYRSDRFAGKPYFNS